MRKILIRKRVPTTQFWLNINQMAELLRVDEDIEVWPGENTKVEVSDSDEENEENKESALDEFDHNDCKDLDGVALSVIGLNKKGEPITATEYQPGGSLVIDIKVFISPRILLFFNGRFRVLRKNSVKYLGALQ